MNELDERVFQLIEILKKTGTIASDYEFAKIIGKPPQHVGNIRGNDNRHFTIEDLKVIHVKFNVNMNWLFGNEKNFFINIGSQNSTQTIEN